MYVGILTYLNSIWRWQFFLEFIVCLRGGTNSSMFANCLVFGDVIEIQSLVFGQNQMFRHVRSSVLKILKKMGPFFVNKVHKLSVFVDVGDVRSSVLGPNGMIECVQSSIL